MRVLAYGFEWNSEELEAKQSFGDFLAVVHGQGIEGWGWTVYSGRGDNIREVETEERFTSISRAIEDVVQTIAGWEAAEVRSEQQLDE